MSQITLGPVTDEGLSINGREYSWLWLLDHSQDDPLYHAAGRQRLLETFSVDDVSPAEVACANDTLQLTWPDGVTASYTAAFFDAVGAPSETYATRAYRAIPWSRTDIEERIVHVAYESFLAADEDLMRALAALGTDGLVLIDGLPLDRGAAGRVFDRIGYVRKSLFGELWNLRSDGEYDDTGSTPLDITPHTDGTYSNDAPGFLGLQCLTEAATGGENVLVDGFFLAAAIRSSDPTAYETLSTVEIPGRYIGDGGHLIAKRPLLRHEHGELVQVSYNNHDRAPLWLPADEMAELYRSLRVFDEAVRDRANQLEFLLPAGTMLLFDNWRMLHGRRAFTGDRHLIGGYLNREDYEGALRRVVKQPLDMVG